MTFTCTICNYETKLKANYTRHLKSKRHIEKIEITTDNEHIITNNAPIITNNNYTCEYCNSNYTKLSSLNRHQKNCVKQILQDKESQIENNQKQLQEKDLQIKELKESHHSELKELKDENKELIKTINKINNKQISVLQKNLKPANTNNSQVIINNYPNAPNIGFPENIPIDRSLNKYVELGGIKGLGKFISDHWAKNINHVDRSIWMVDPSRNKFLIRIDNAWVIDIDGTHFQELNLEKIQSIFNEYSEKNKFDTYDYLKTVEFITDIRTKNMIVRGLKDAGKYLVYDKEKFTDFNKLGNEIIPESETIVD